MSQHPAPLPSSCCPAFTDHNNTGFIYFWAHTHAVYIIDQSDGVHYPEPNALALWEEADDALRNSYKSLERAVRDSFTEDALRRNQVVDTILATSHRTREGTMGAQTRNPYKAKTQDEERIEVLACALYENIQWELFKTTARINGIIPTKTIELRVRMESRKRCVTLEATHPFKAACIEKAKEKEDDENKQLSRRQPFHDAVTFDLKTELDWIDELALCD